MSARHENQRRPNAAGHAGAASRPPTSPEVPDLAARYMREAHESVSRAAPVRPPPPKWPMLSGVFSFPWYVQTLGPWLGISLGLVVTGLLLLMLIGPGAQLGLLGVRIMMLPVCVAGLLTFGYAAACCLTIIEETSYGCDSINTWPDMNWKEWAWPFTYGVALVLEAALIGMGVRLIVLSSAWLPSVIGTLAAFPLVLLGALAADSAWVPLKILPVLRSLPSLWWAWVIFYLSTTAMMIGWMMLAMVGLMNSPWWVPLYCGPLLAALMLIYARLIGRLAKCIAADIESRESQEEP